MAPGFSKCADTAVRHLDVGDSVYMQLSRFRGDHLACVALAFGTSATHTHHMLLTARYLLKPGRCDVEEVCLSPDTVTSYATLMFLAAEVNVPFILLDV